jgi:hypothetical protein
MKRLLESIRVIKNTFEKNGYICKNHEGKPFFGEIHVSLNDGKIIHSKNKCKCEFNITESIKI